MQRWIIIYIEDRTTLSLALAWDYQLNEYLRASRESFDHDNKKEATEYLMRLAKDHNLKADTDLDTLQELLFLD